MNTTLWPEEWARNGEKMPQQSYLREYSAKIMVTPISGKKGKHQILLKMADRYIANRTTACLLLFLAYRAQQVHQLNLQSWEQMITESSQHGETRCAICLSGSRILPKMWWAQDLQNLVVQFLYIPLVLGNTMRPRTSPQARIAKSANGPK